MWPAVTSRLKNGKRIRPARASGIRQRRSVRARLSQLRHRQHAVYFLHRAAGRRRIPRVRAAVGKRARSSPRVWARPGRQPRLTSVCASCQCMAPHDVVGLLAFLAALEDWAMGYQVKVDLDLTLRLDPLRTCLWFHTLLTQLVQVYNPKNGQRFQCSESIVSTWLFTEDPAIFSLCLFPVTNPTLGPVQFNPAGQ